MIIYIYIIDLIGSFAGMDYYDNSLVKLLEPEQQVQILSTYSGSNRRPFLPIMFKKSKIHSILIMVWIYLKLLFHLLIHRKASYIYMSFGEIYDFLFFTLSLFNKRFFVDIHEAYASQYYDKSFVIRVFGAYYKHVVKNVICHSEKTTKIMNDFEFHGNMLYVPHLKYNINTDYNKNNLAEDVLSAFQTTKKKMLFFGNLRKVKGIDIIVDYFSHNDVSSYVELVVAGRNVENINFGNMRSRYKIIDRHVNDDELKYLYSKTDFVLLPYRESSQSGVLEMAFAFKKILLLSNIKYFNDVLTKYPSFGEKESVEKYGNLLDKAIFKSLNEQKCYYCIDDCNRFMMKDEMQKFKNDFCTLINKC